MRNHVVMNMSAHVWNGSGGAPSTASSTSFVLFLPFELCINPMTNASWSPDSTTVQPLAGMPP